MKNLVSKQFLNVIFIILVVGAALLIYFLSRTQTQSANEVTKTASSPQITAGSGDIFDASASFYQGGVPESVWLTHLQTGDDFTAEPVSDDDHIWLISCETNPVVTAQLIYTVDGGRVSSVELALALPEAVASDSNSAIEQYLASSDEAAQNAQNDAVRILLSDLLPACDAADAVSMATVSLWVEKVAQIKDEGDDYSAKENGVAFIAYRTQRQSVPLLICSFFMDS